MSKIDRDGIRAVVRSPWTMVPIAFYAAYVALNIAVGITNPTGFVLMLAFMAVASTCTIYFTYGMEVDRKKAEARRLEDDLRAEMRDRENDIIAASRASAEYRETLRHTPAAQAILDRRDAELQEHAARARAARLARLQAAGKLPV